MLADFQTIHPRQLQYDSNITVGVIFPFLNDKCELFDKGNNPLFFDNKTRTKRTISHFVFDNYIRTGSFWDIINNQVHIFPSLIIDYGLVLSQKETEYYIWNAYTSKSVFIEESVGSGDIGITLQFDYAGDFTLGPGQGVPGVMTVFVEGPVSAKTYFAIPYTVQGEERNSFGLSAECTRIILFPFFPDWRESVKFEIKFETTIARFLTLKEQRRPLMKKPQRFVSFTNTDFIRGLTENAMDFAEDKAIGIPIAHELFTLTSIDSDKMGVVTRQDTSKLWNLKRYCDYVSFYDLESNRIFAKRIVGVTSNHLVFDTPLLDSVVNFAKVICFPTIIGMFKSANMTNHSGDLSSWEIEFEEKIGEDQPDLVGVPSLPDTFPLSLEANSIKNIHTINRDVGGFPGTAQTIYSRFPYDKKMPKGLEGSLIMDETQLSSFLDFVCAARGRTYDFVVTSLLNDFRVVEPIYEGANQLKVENCFYGESFSRVLNKDVVVKYRGDSVDLTISSVSSNVNYTTITFNTIIPYRIFSEDMDTVRIEKKMRVRSDLDVFTINCLSGSSFSVNLRFVEVVI